MSTRYRDFTRNSVLSRITCVISRTRYLTQFVREIAHNRAITHCTRKCANTCTREGVQSVIAQASLENMWLQITDQRGEFSGELVSIADIVYFSAAYKPVQCTQTANGFVLVPKSSHSTFASSRICGYSSLGRYVGSPFHLRFHIFFHLPCDVRTGIHSRSIV